MGKEGGLERPPSAAVHTASTPKHPEDASATHPQEVLRVLSERWSPLQPVRIAPSAGEAMLVRGEASTVRGEAMLVRGQASTVSARATLARRGATGMHGRARSA